MGQLIGFRRASPVTSMTSDHLMWKPPYASTLSAGEVMGTPNVVGERCNGALKAVSPFPLPHRAHCNVRSIKES